MKGEGEEEQEVNIVYKTKVVQFLGRQVPIILQNDNGPCPLLAICNVLLLRNNLNVSTDLAEISLPELLSLIAERLLDVNSNIKNKDEEYVRNQQQNISDAIALLPRLATGIDVNVRFTHIHDFEFTPECAIFDLFDIGLVHGWLCDPQDEETSQMIGNHSYNALVEKLVALQASKGDSAANDVTGAVEESTVDFVAATTATLGVPTPSASQLWSSETSFEDLSYELNQGGPTTAANESPRKGDTEEAAALMQALQLSQSDGLTRVGTEDSGTSGKHDTDLPVLLTTHGTSPLLSSLSDDSTGNIDPQLEVIEMPEEGTELGVHEESISLNPVRRCPQGLDVPVRSFKQPIVPTPRLWLGEEKTVSGSHFAGASAANEEGLQGPSNFEGNDNIFVLGYDIDHPVKLLDVGEEDSESQRKATAEDPLLGHEHKAQMNDDGTSQRLHPNFGTDGFENVTKEQLCDTDEKALQKHERDSTLGDSRKQFLVRGPGSLGSSQSLESSGLDDEEPLYEGECDLANQGVSKYSDKEPLYEGEVILAEKGDIGGQLLDKSEAGSPNFKQSVAVSDREGKIIENFLNNNASQLTVYGLIEGLKDRELCVFFRNNHFSTMFKFNRRLYLLASDQGYLNQPDLVWEELSSVDGDTVFTTGSFSVFQADHRSNTWNEQDAVAATADYMSSHNKPADHGGRSIYKFGVGYCPAAARA
ncbi:hypothetical protein CY35_07G085600 [Sphagnum magellanicum]|uniref:Uncharacterized protein n=1 Tax=Sphagnum magellanicum TaxID=128215 RepID=A0ACB8HMK7_9BRYO|nr:hypothetical protein CY35_07G085600 [Sphagnum magellanicum]